MAKRRVTRAALAAAGVVLALAVTPAAQTNRPPLYTCVEGAMAVEAPLVGVELCDAAPTDALLARAVEDNLQVLSGALVVSADPDGVGATEGLQADDVIYRVGGVDVAGAEAAAERLAGIVSERDTLANFLRRGRPYLVKLRR